MKKLSLWLFIIAALLFSISLYLVPELQIWQKCFLAGLSIGLIAIFVKAEEVF